MTDPTLSLNVNEPWSTDEELTAWFNITYDQQESQDVKTKLDNYLWAKDVIQKWRVRCKSSVEMETVSLLLEADVERLKNELSKDEPDSFPVASLYAAALIRFCQVLRNYTINDCGDVIRVRHAKPLTKNLVESLNVPHWVIDLRNEACHSKTPRLALLRQASLIIQHWLLVNFWTPKIRKAEDFEFGKMSRFLQKFCSKLADETKSFVVSALETNHHKTLRAVVYLLSKSMDVEKISNFEELVIPSDVRKQIQPIVNLVINQNRIHELLHLLINIFVLENGNLYIPAIVWFKDLILSLIGREESVHTSKTVDVPRKFQTQLQSKQCIQLIYLRIVHHLLEKPMAYTPKLVGLFAVLFTGTKYCNVIEKLSTFASLFVGCDEPAIVLNKKKDPKSNDVDTLKRHLSSKLYATDRIKKVRFERSS